MGADDRGGAGRETERHVDVELRRESPFFCYFMLYVFLFFVELRRYSYSLTGLVCILLGGGFILSWVSRIS